MHAVPTPVYQSINLSHIIDPPPSTSPLTTTSKGAEAARHVTGPPCPCNTCRGCGGSGRAAHCRSAEELFGTPLPSTCTRTVQSAEAVTRKTPRASCQEPTTVMHVTMSLCTGTSCVAAMLATPPPPPSIRHAPMQPSWSPFARSTANDPRSRKCTVCVCIEHWKQCVRTHVLVSAHSCERAFDFNRHSNAHVPTSQRELAISLPPFSPRSQTYYMSESPSRRYVVLLTILDSSTEPRFVTSARANSSVNDTPCIVHTTKRRQGTSLAAAHKVRECRQVQHASVGRTLPWSRASSCTHGAHMRHNVRRTATKTRYPSRRQLQSAPRMHPRRQLRG